MGNNENYGAKVRPRPEIAGDEILWGWDVDLTDKSDEVVYPFSGVAQHKSAQEAVTAGAHTMLRWMNALAVVKDVGIQDVNLDSSIPEPEVEETPSEEEPKEEAAPVEEDNTSETEAPAEPATETSE